MFGERFRYEMCIIDINTGDLSIEEKEMFIYIFFSYSFKLMIWIFNLYVMGLMCNFMVDFCILMYGNQFPLMIIKMYGLIFLLRELVSFVSVKSTNLQK